MSASPLDSYLRALERALRERGHEATRIVDEAREHLADAVEDGLRRGLAREHAEREALERFGPPDVIAAQAPPERSRMMARVTAALDTLIGHWRWMTAATALAALLASMGSYYFLETMYRSESVILVLRPPLPPWSMEPSTDRFHERMQSITQGVLSSPRLERIVKEFGLDEQRQVRRDISVVALTPASDATIGSFKVGFQASDPRLSMKVAERLTSLFIQENLEQREAEPTAEAIGVQFKVIQRPPLPDKPIGPNRAGVAVSGAFAGLALSIAALLWRRAPAAD
ncbi:MAG TPA: permease prefix domain 1-containing protein [Vicinamibacterales bacterium]|nr:permease prefix domain 1-containing protein [Vicinamibacterales bacterium]